MKILKYEDNVSYVSATLQSIDGTKIYENIVFSANDVTDSISNSDKESMLIKISGVGSDETEQRIVGVLDLSMIIRDKDSNGNIISEKEYQPDGKVLVTLKLPEDLFSKFDNVVLNHFLDEGSAEKINYTRDGYTVTFETSGFSNYVFTGKLALKSISVTTNPTKLTYLKDKDNLDASGGKITLECYHISRVDRHPKI